MLGIGPMSPNLIQACFELGRDLDMPIMFIASRNQVDADEFGAGYVNGWDQYRFASDLKAIRITSYNVCYTKLLRFVKNITRYSKIS